MIKLHGDKRKQFEKFDIFRKQREDVKETQNMHECDKKCQQRLL